MLFYIYLSLSLLGSAGIVYLKKPENVFAIAGLFLLYFILLYLLFFLLHLLVFAIGGYTINVNNLPKDIHTFYRWYGFETLVLFMKSLHIRIHVHGMEYLPKDAPFLLVANHRSIFDPMIGLVYLKPYNLAYVSKQENLKIPFVGRYIAAVGCLPLDRENPRNAVKSIKQAADNIKSGYANYGIYPEGGENKTPDPLLPFRAGALKIAKDANCRIVLSAFRGSDKIFRRAFTFRPIHIHMDILKEYIPEETVKAEKASELSDRAFRILWDHLTEHPADRYLSARD
ncbi:MAG: 1-acyl-sn-glycerol-3-phosphate acyltransferase [Eubacterium sp.]|nr:1-acyl-sn-glycerol-3-phosphate acyltransferase [Eubacterium sp.]